MKNFLVASSVALVFALSAGALRASPLGPNGHVVVLGDSLSDTGNLTLLTGGLLPPSPLYDPPRQQRYADGNIWTDAFASALGLTLNNVTVGATAPMGNGFVDNYAISGTLSGTYQLLGGSDDINNFVDVVNAALGDPVQGVPGFAQQLGFYQFVGVDPDATHIIWAGANDLLYADILTPPDAATVPEQAALNIKNALLNLNASGVEHLIVANLPDLGKTPFADGDQVAPIVSPTPAELTALTKAFNQALDVVLADVPFMVGLVDIYALVEAATTDPASFGFTNIDDACIDVTTLATSCVNPEEYVFWDDLHPTSAAHAFIAEQFVQAAVPLPGTLALLFAGCIFVVPAAARRRRCAA